MDFNDTLDELNITLGDTDNVTFTPEEKQRALRKAWNDAYVVTPVRNTALTFTLGTYNQALPSGITTVTGISLSPSNTLTADFPYSVSGDLYSVIGGTIYWKNAANSVIPTGYTLYVNGNYKLDPDTDTITDVNMQEYVIALAGYNSLTLLGHKKANLFLKNDTTMAELITLRRELKQEVLELRGKLARAYEGA